MKKLLITIGVIALAASNMYSQTCQNITAIGGIGNQTTTPYNSLIKDGYTYFWGVYGAMGIGYSTTFTVDGKTFNPGPCDNPSNGDYTAYICKLNPDNSLAWFIQTSKSHHVSEWLNIIDLEADNDGNIYFTTKWGHRDNVNFGKFIIPGDDYCKNALVKLSPDGDLLWYQKYSDDIIMTNATAMNIDSSGNPYLLVHFENYKKFRLSQWDKDVEFLAALEIKHFYLKMVCQLTFQTANPTLPMPIL